jgi:hypothetical protein
MTAQELNEIVDQRLSDPSVLGRLVCNLRSSDEIHQRHNDPRKFAVRWQDCGDFWRCTVTDADAPALRLAQIDLHENATVRADVFEPCRVTISPEEGFLCLTRYRVS